MSNTLVTGAAGFIGAHVAAKLGAIGVDNFNPYYDPDYKRRRVAALGVDCRTLDVTDYGALSGLFWNNEFDRVVHLAAQPGVRHSLTHPHDYAANVTGFLNVLECCRQFGVQHLVYASSSSVYGANEVPFRVGDWVDCPLNLYAATKKANELMAHAYGHLYGFATTGLRFFTVYGPWGRPDMAPLQFARALRDGQPIELYGTCSRDWTYIDDIVRGVEIAMDHPNGYSLHNIGCGNPVSVTGFVGALAAELGVTPEIWQGDPAPGDMRDTWADTESLEALGYWPEVPVAEGVRRFAEWFKCEG